MMTVVGSRTASDWSDMVVTSVLSMLDKSPAKNYGPEFEVSENVPPVAEVAAFAVVSKPMNCAVVPGEIGRMLMNVVRRVISSCSLTLAYLLSRAATPREQQAGNAQQTERCRLGDGCEGKGTVVV